MAAPPSEAMKQYYADRPHLLEGSPIDPSEPEVVRARLPEVLKALGIGDEVAIRQTHGGILTFTVTKVEAISKTGRIVTERGNAYGYKAWHRKSGKNTMQPTGQSSLVEATPEVMAFTARYRNGTMNYRTHLSPRWQEPEAWPPPPA